MAKIDLSQRDRHALKWHLNGIRTKDRVEDKALDRVWKALKLDDIVTKSDADPATLDITPVTYDELTSADRDQLIEWMNAPKLGIMSRLLRAIDERLITSRDGDNSK
ncbi:MAG TPA: hypothetical protein VGY48_15690 [Vicinamibacterales bacterium]|jgi:hypothetical protein|nr:hypothetical protein [Vicinamibacterales bacterium]